MSDVYTNMRTQAVLSVLLRIESFISCLVRTAIAIHTSQPSDTFMIEARTIVRFDHELGQAGAGLSRWAIPDPCAGIWTFLRVMNQIVTGLEGFRGSSQGLTAKGKELVDRHFSILSLVRQAVVFAFADPQDSAGIQFRLERASFALLAQIAEVKPLALDGPNAPWTSYSPASIARKGCGVVIFAIIAMSIIAWLAR